MDILSFAAHFTGMSVNGEAKYTAVFGRRWTHVRMPGRSAKERSSRRVAGVSTCPRPCARCSVAVRQTGWVINRRCPRTFLPGTSSPRTAELNLFKCCHVRAVEQWLGHGNETATYEFVPAKSVIMCRQKIVTSLLIKTSFNKLAPTVAGHGPLHKSIY